jgi:hypothetical protein
VISSHSFLQFWAQSDVAFPILNNSNCHWADGGTSPMIDKKKELCHYSWITQRVILLKFQRS